MLFGTTLLLKWTLEFELAVLDCGGVLVDSERTANEVCAKKLTYECGFYLVLEGMFELFVGHSSRQCMSILREIFGKEPPYISKSGMKMRCRLTSGKYNDLF